MLIRKNKKGKVKGNPLLNGVSGMLGKVFVIKQYKDMVVFANRPAKTKKKPSKKQILQRSLFRRAQSYAQAVKKNPKKSAKYAKNLNGKRNVYQAALSDFMRREKKGEDA